MKNRRAVATISIVAIAALLIVSVAVYNFADAAKPGGGGGGGDSKAANKAMIGTSDLSGVLNYHGWSPIISGTIKTSSTSDLLVRHYQECAIHTGLKLDATNDDLTSAIREDVRLRIDGKIVPASYDEDPDAKDYGVVTMCGRAYHIETNVLDNIDALCDAQAKINPLNPCTLDPSYFDSFIRTKQAHSWEWVALNLGSGDHTVVVEARSYTALDGMTAGSEEAMAEASDTESCKKDRPLTDCIDTVLEIGKRSLIAEEEKLAVSASLYS